MTVIRTRPVSGVAQPTAVGSGVNEGDRMREIATEFDQLWKPNNWTHKAERQMEALGKRHCSRILANKPASFLPLR